jgi:hypothetical protein
VKAVRTALKQIQRHLHGLTTDVENRQLIDARIRYLEEAVEPGRPKIDWLNIVIGQMLAMVMAGLIESNQWAEAMRYARFVLETLFDIGGHLLGP